MHPSLGAVWHFLLCLLLTAHSHSQTRVRVFAFYFAGWEQSAALQQENIKFGLEDSTHNYSVDKKGKINSQSEFLASEITHILFLLISGATCLTGSTMSERDASDCESSGDEEAHNYTCKHIYYTYNSAIKSF